MNIDIRDILGPTLVVPEFGDPYADIFAEVRTILRAWVDLGRMDISNTTVFNLLCSWDVRNTGTAPGYAGLKASVIETRGGMTDELWFQYTPLSREGGPGEVTDLMYAQTAGLAQATPWGSPLQEIPAGATRALTCNWEIPGPLVGAAASFWYDRHPTPTFKMGVEVLEVSTLAGAHVRSIADRTLTSAFALKAIKVLAPTLAVVGEPSIGWGLVLGGGTVTPTPTTLADFLALIAAATTKAELDIIVGDAYAMLPYNEYLRVYEAYAAKWPSAA